MTYEEFIDALQVSGWRSTCDAQHDGAFLLWKRIFPPPAPARGFMGSTVYGEIDDGPNDADEPTNARLDPQPPGHVQCPECLAGFPFADAIRHAENDLTAMQGAQAAFTCNRTKGNLCTYPECKCDGPAVDGGCAAPERTKCSRCYGNPPVKCGLCGALPLAAPAACANCGGSGIVPIGDGYSVDGCPACNPPPCDNDHIAPGSERFTEPPASRFDDPQYRAGFDEAMDLFKRFVSRMAEE